MTKEECEEMFGDIPYELFIPHNWRTDVMKLGEVRVIHGKGTGVLRSAVREYLKKCTFVKSHRLGTFGECEDGVSIVTLK